MPTRRALILFVRDERNEARLKPLPSPFRALGYTWLNRRIADRAFAGAHVKADLIVVSERVPQSTPGDTYLVQRGANFAERITNAIADTFARGYQHVVVIGNDCPSITAADIDAAFKHLACGAGYVASPASDGGAYLVGANADTFNRTAFGQLPWQTRRLFRALISLPGAAAVAITRDDFDTWIGVSATHALGMLLLGAGRMLQCAARRAPTHETWRHKALTRIHLPAPPAIQFQ